MMNMGQEIPDPYYFNDLCRKVKNFPRHVSRSRFHAANFDAGQCHGKNKPKHAHDPRIIPKIIRQAAYQGAAHGRAGGTGDGTSGGVTAVADGMGRPLDVPQHRADEAHNAKQPRFDPYLQEKVMGMDERRLAVI